MKKTQPKKPRLFCPSDSLRFQNAADSKYVADTALRKEGVIDPGMDRFAVENRRPLAEHVADYLAHCPRAGQAEKHIAEKVRHLGRMLAGTGATRLSELTADILEGWLRVC
jgi:hypothetical protein